MKAIKIILISLSIILFSCSSDDNSDLPEILPETIKLVKSEKLSDTNKVEYLYNDNNLISSSTGVSNNITWVEYAIYNSNQDIIKLNSQESGSSTYSNIYVFNYDSQNRLINYSAKTEDVNLEYNGNKVILTGRIEGYFDSEAELELNNAGIITKFIENNQYTIFEYDTKGNMTTAKSYDNNNNLTQEFSISYDNKINPFYGQLKSIYIERFIEFFWKFDGIYFTGFGGYSFPFSKNNIISISKNSIENTIYTYTYDNENYPTNVIKDTYQFDIEYY